MQKLVLLIPRTKRISLVGHDGNRDGSLILHDVGTRTEVFFLGLDDEDQANERVSLTARVTKRDRNCHKIEAVDASPGTVHFVVKCGKCPDEFGLRFGLPEGEVTTDVLNDLITDISFTDASTDDITDATNLFTDDSTDLNTDEGTEQIQPGFMNFKNKKIQELIDIENWFFG